MTYIRCILNYGSHQRWCEMSRKDILSLPRGSRHPWCDPNTKLDF